MISKPFDELKKEKLQAEIDLLNKRIEKDYAEVKSLTRSERITAFVKKWYGFILALITVFGGFWTIYFPVQSYFDSQRKALHYSLNDEMIKAIDSLTSLNQITVEKSILILSYFESNAIPILVFNIERSDGTSLENYYSAIREIYKQNSTDIVETIIERMNYYYYSLGLFQDSVVETPNYNTLTNFSRLLNNIKLNWMDKRHVKNFYYPIQKTLKTNERLGVQVPSFIKNIDQFLNDN
jgi:hypothetical protein